MDTNTLFLLKNVVISGSLLEKETFVELDKENQAIYINLVSFYRNGRGAIIINDNHYYDADDNEEITDLVEYAENLHDYGYKLFD